MFCCSESVFIIIIKKHPSESILFVSVMVGKVGTAEHHLQDQITHERSQKSLEDRLDDKNKNKRKSE